jgi:hypothetical protein
MPSMVFISHSSKDRESADAICAQGSGESFLLRACRHPFPNQGCFAKPKSELLPGHRSVVRCKRSAFAEATRHAV